MLRLTREPWRFAPNLNGMHVSYRYTSNMKRLVVFIVAALVGLACAPSSDYPAYVKKELYAKNDLRGKTAPKLEVGKWLKNGDPKTAGKVVLIDFWATWCPPCRKTIPELNEWQKKFKGDLVVIGVSDEAEKTVKDFMGKTAMDYSVAVDPEKKMSNIVGVQGIPHILVVTPDHVVRWQGFPLQAEDTLTTEKLAQIIKASKDKG